MKKIINNTILGFLIFILITFVTGCTNDITPKITLGVSGEVEINYDEVKNLGAVSEPESVIKYYSNNKNIVTVDENGNIKGVGIGEAKIRVYLEKKPEIEIIVTVIVKPFELSIQGEDEVFAGSEIILTATDEQGGQDLVWDSSNNLIASVDQNGKVKGVKVGTVTISIISNITGEIMTKEIQVLKPAVASIEVSRANSGRVLIFDEVRIVCSVAPSAANQNVIWSSSDENIATVDETGLVKAHRSGTVDIIATSIENVDIEGKFTLNVEVDPIELLRYFNVASPIHQRASSKLIPELNDYIYGSVNLYWPANMNLIIEYVPIDQKLDEANNLKSDNPYIGLTVTQDIINAVEFKSIRPGVLKTGIENIIFHDTGNYTIGTGARNHATYMVGTWNRTVNYNYGKPYGYRSWHYTVDDKEIIQHIPDNEIGFHGDTYEAYTTTIGIETAISKGTNFFTTWHRTAKLMSSLMSKYDLSIENIKQHYDFSGKDCPQVLRASGLWSTALKMIEAEYLVLEELGDYKIEFISNAPEYVNNEGRIIKLDSVPRLISYQVKITNNSGYNKTTVLYSTLPAKII